MPSIRSGPHHQKSASMSQRSTIHPFRTFGPSETGDRLTDMSVYLGKVVRFKPRITPGQDICAKLVTFRDGRKEAVVLSLNRPVVIGRNAELCSYVVNDPLVSGVHCKLYAVRSPGGGVIVSCQDMSRNGFLLNEQPIKKTSVILLNGDRLELPSSLVFECVHLWKDFGAKLTLFEPTPPTNPTHKRIGSYIVVSQRLGSGSFATVHLALDPVNHRQVACKSIRIKREHEISQVMKEVAILMTLKHPNINEIYDTEENSKFIHIFLQLCTGGDLFTYITHKSHGGNRMCEAEAKYIMYQLLLGIKYLHDKLISHRDLKPENILFHRPGPYPRVLIGDFGLARLNSYQETLNVCGTISYLPPEGVLALDNKHLGYVGMPADCWSAGVILYIMICGSHPFDYSTPEPSADATRMRTSYSQSQPTGTETEAQNVYDIKLKARIVKGHIDYFRDPWAELSDARGLVDALLVYEPNDRATVLMALRHRWFLCEMKELAALYQTRILENECK